MSQIINVFFLPYAGGNKFSYREFKSKHAPHLHFVMLEYPGHGARLSEPLFTDIHKVVEDVFEQIKDRIQKEEYAIYGHSMGGLVAYLLSIKIREAQLREPLHLFITGTTGPSATSRGEKKRHQMEQAEFFRELKELGGMPDEILESDELLHYFEPILRADFEASESYMHNIHPALNVPITVITGAREDFEASDVLLWQNESVHKVDFKKLPGTHFFLFNYIPEIIQVIAKKLMVANKVSSSV